MKSIKCSRKRVYKTEREARERSLMYYRSHGFINKVYQCPKCKDYHLTTNSRTKDVKKVLFELMELEKLDKLEDLELEYSK